MLLTTKLLHIAAVGLWFGGLVLLPALLAAHARRVRAGGDDAAFIPIARRLYFHVATPAAVAAVVIGGGLLAVTPAAAWLPAKLGLVAAALLLHVYLGLALFDLSNGRSRHRPGLFVAFGFVPAVLAVGILGLTAVKPSTLAPFDAETVVPAPPLPREPGQPDDPG